MNFLRSAQPTVSDQPRTRQENIHSTAPPLDETAVRALLDRLNFVERPVEGRRTVGSTGEFSLVTPHTGLKEPDPTSPNLFWFRKQLRGAMGALNCDEDDFQQTFQLRYSAMLDPAILQYFAMNGTYQMQIVDCEAKLQFTPNEGASGVLYTELSDQSVVTQTFSNNYSQNQQFEIRAGPAVPIDSDLSAVVATFKVSARDARLMGGSGHADSAVWLTLNTLVRFDGYTMPTAKN